MGRMTAAAQMGIQISFSMSLKSHLSISAKLSGIALLFLSLSSHSCPHLCTDSSQVQPEIIKPSDSLSTAWPAEKSLKLYCYHHCMSWRQAAVYWRWAGANFHWAEDSSVRPLLAVHKQEQTPCVPACVRTCGRWSTHVYLWAHADVREDTYFCFPLWYQKYNSNKKGTLASEKQRSKKKVLSAL